MTERGILASGAIALAALMVFAVWQTPKMATGARQEAGWLGSGTDSGARSASRTVAADTGSAAIAKAPAPTTGAVTTPPAEPAAANTTTAATVAPQAAPAPAVAAAVPAPAVTAAPAPAVLAAPEPATDLVATYSDGKIVLSGSVPDASARSLMVSRAVLIYGGDRVVDELAVRNVQWSDTTLNAIAAFPPDLRGARAGEARLQGATLSVRADVPDSASAKALDSLLTRSLVPGLELKQSLEVREAAKAVPVTADRPTGDALGMVTFYQGSARLTVQARQTLDAIASQLLADPSAKVIATGHTDDRGPALINEQLSSERALAVARYLVARGVAEDRIRTQSLATARPLGDNDTVEGRWANRRVELSRAT